MSVSSELEGWDAVETAERIAAGEVSAAEVVEAAIDRARHWQPRIHAIVTETYERARQQAAELPAGPFGGVPTFVKDLENLEGVATRYGSAAVGDYVAPNTADSVKQFLSTGVISLGKSTTAEFGLTATTEPLHGQPTRNPNNLDHSAGGSSGGAAALVAAGVVPIAHGGDGGGSIRIPAAFCGLIGLKATRGRLARMASSKRMPVKIATYGLLSRTVRDTAAFFAAVDDGSDTLPAIGKVEGPSQARLRVGKFVDGPFGHDVDPAVREAVESTARRLEGAGHTVIDIEPPYTESLADDFLLHWGFMAAGVVMTMRLSKSTDASKLEPWTRGLARFMAKRWWKVPAAIVRLRRFGDQYAKVFEGCDVILSPTTGAPAPPIGHLSPGLEFEAKLERIYRLLPYTPVQNASGGPAISLPVARTSDGLPVGIQLAGPSGEERRLLELAFELEDGLVGPVPVD